MTERERLCEILCKLLSTKGKCSFGCIAYSDNTYTLRDCKDCGLIADYLLKNGVIVPQLQMGQEVWYVNNSSPFVKNFSGRITRITVANYEETYTMENTGNIRCRCDFSVSDIGKTVFLSQEEAERALEVKE